MQRLFSAFPNSWPGLGLLILRFAAGLLFADLAHHIADFTATGEVMVRCGLWGIAVLIWVGLWTPPVAIAGAAIQILLLFFGRRFDPSLLVYAALVLSLAMLGPGAWSVDARMFGRKRIL